MLLLRFLKPFDIFTRSVAGSVAGSVTESVVGTAAGTVTESVTVHVAVHVTGSVAQCHELPLNREAFHSIF